MLVVNHIYNNAYLQGLDLYLDLKLGLSWYNSQFSSESEVVVFKVGYPRAPGISRPKVNVI